MPAARWIAIAAMAQNRVIGANNTLPWHLPEDFRFFKEQTMGQVLVMGRKTYASIGKPLPGRQTLVISRTLTSLPGVSVLPDLDALHNYESDKLLYICGGAEIYRQCLPDCEALYLTRVKMRPEGDAFFPDFESLFDFKEVLKDTESFQIEQHTRKILCD